MSTPTATAAPDRLVRALEADLVGPFDLDQAETFEEVLHLPPSRWYLTVFLAPEEGRQVVKGGGSGSGWSADLALLTKPPAIATCTGLI